MTETLKPRQPKGIPIGGEFAAYKHNEPGFALNVARHRQSMAERRELLRSPSFVPSTALPAVTMPSSTAHRAEWWDTSMVAGEFRPDGKTIPKMPDDFSPSMGSGQAMSGHRRTNRQNYGNSEIDLRMPSKTSVEAWSQLHGNPTFDVPVSVSVKGGAPVEGHVRVTKTGPQSWKATSLIGAGDNAAMLSEAVNAVLESRRVSTALTKVPDLLEAHRLRQQAQGSEMGPVSSHFIEEVGYDEASGTMATRIGNKLYGHRVSKSLFEAVKDSPRPGTVFNQKVKANPGAHVDRCDKCKRFYSASVAHVCPTSHKPAAGIGLDYIEKVKQRAELVAARASRGVDPALARNVVQPPPPVNTAPSPHAQPVPLKKTGVPGRPAAVGFSGLGAQPVPVKKTGVPGRRAAVAFSGVGAQPAPPHLAAPIRSQTDYTAEIAPLKASARAQGYDFLGNRLEARAEVSCNTETYNAWIAAGTDGTLQRFLNGKPVEAYGAEHRKAQEMEQWATRNALGMARVTDAEEYIRSLRAARS